MADNKIEEKIWEAADILRGNLDASEYKQVVLGLIFLKYVSDKFEQKYNELKEEGEGFEEDLDEYISENIFFVPKKSRWLNIVDMANTKEIGITIDNALLEIEKENKKLKDILFKNFARPELDKRRLGEIVTLFDNINMQDVTGSTDILGNIYEYCLAKFAEKEGKNAGEFYTPKCIVETIVNMLEPYEGRVYDPCCGSGGMFVQSAKFIKNHSGNINNISIYGQDANPTTRKLAILNLAIRGIEADLGQYNADTFYEDLHKNLRADYIMANPPFNLSNWGSGALSDDIRWKYGVPPDGNANFAWIQHMIYHLAPNGQMGIVLANGALSSQISGEGDIRAKIVKDDLVDCIIAMPSNLFSSTAIPVSLWFLRKDKKQKGKTLFIDAREMGEMKTRKLRVLMDKDIQELVDIHKKYLDGTLKDKAGHYAIVTTDEIKKQDYILTPGRYVGIEEQEEDSEPFDEKMDRLTKELGEMFKESNKLENEIKERLGDIGYKI